MMTPTIITLQEKKMLGMHLEMSLVNNRTGELFQKFMPRKKEISDIISDGVYALQQYDFKSFNPHTVFEKWACVEIDPAQTILDGMETFQLKSGLYAVFNHKGTTKEFIKTMGFITQIWEPKSAYQIDNSRPHFEYLDHRYLGPNNPLSEEEIWIPIKK